VRALTLRETQVLSFVANGFSNVETGAELGISAMTVRSHVSSILSKLGVHTRAHAVAIAMQHGWIPGPFPSNGGAAA
jgi:DNA-binding CsgD family transcriptional regulator